MISSLKKSDIDFQVSMVSLHHADVYLARLLSGFPDFARRDLDVLKVDCLNSLQTQANYTVTVVRFANLHRWISTHTRAL